MEGGSIAAPLVKFKAASAENLYHCNDKGEDEGLGQTLAYSASISQNRKIQK